MENSRQWAMVRWFRSHADIRLPKMTPIMVIESFFFDQQYQGTQGNRALGAEYLITDIAANRYIAKCHGAESSEYNEGICIIHAKLSYKKSSQYSL